MFFNGRNFEISTIRVILVDIESEMKKSFIDYAMSVIVAGFARC